MPSRTNSPPEVRIFLASFDLFPRNDARIMQRANYDLRNQLKKNAKEKRIISKCNAYRVSPHDNHVVIEYIDTEKKKDFQIRLRVIYQLVSVRF